MASGRHGLPTGAFGSMAQECAILITYEISLPASHPFASAGNVKADDTRIPVGHRRKMAELGRNWKFERCEEHEDGRKKLVFHSERGVR